MHHRSKGQYPRPQNIPTNTNTLYHLLKPYLSDLALAVECMFTWYWIADSYRKYNITFILGHALYMKAIHSAKTKNDKIDSHKIPCFCVAD